MPADEKIQRNNFNYRLRHADHDQCEKTKTSPHSDDRRSGTCKGYYDIDSVEQVKARMPLQYRNLQTSKKINDCNEPHQDCCCDKSAPIEAIQVDRPACQANDNDQDRDRDQREAHENRTCRSRRPLHFGSIVLRQCLRDVADDCGHQPELDQCKVRKKNID